MLTDEQYQAFRRNGFLVIRDAVEEDLCEAALDVTWESLPVDRDDPDSWRGIDLHESDELSTTAPFVALTGQVFRYVDAMVGTGELAPTGETPMELCLHTSRLSPAPNYPQKNPTWEDPKPHLDGYAFDNGPPDVEYLPFTIAATLYLDRVRPRGGGFTVWPRSHTTMGEYFESGEWEDLEDGSVQEGLGINLGNPLEITGDAGTLVLWHHNTAHTAGPNMSDRVRMATIGRFSHRDIDKIGRDGLSDPWRHYESFE